LRVCSLVENKFSSFIWAVQQGQVKISKIIISVIYLFFKLLENSVLITIIFMTE